MILSVTAPLDVNLAGYTAQTYTIIRNKLVMVINWEIPISENDG